MPGATATMPPPMPLLPGTPTSYSQSPEVRYIPAVAMTASTRRHVSALTACWPVSGLTPPSARVAPMTARSVAVTLRQHCLV